MAKLGDASPKYGWRSMDVETLEACMHSTSSIDDAENVDGAKDAGCVSQMQEDIYTEVSVQSGD